MFVSYPRGRTTDLVKVRTLVEILRKHGVDTWLADDRLTGWDVRLDLIDEAIDAATAFVACIGAGPRATNGQRELERAARRAEADTSFVLAVVRLPDFAAEAEFLLPAAFRSAPVFDYSDGTFDVGDLAALLRPGSPGEPPIPPTQPQTPRTRPPTPRAQAPTPRTQQQAPRTQPPTTDASDDPADARVHPEDVPTDIEDASDPNAEPDVSDPLEPPEDQFDVTASATSDTVATTDILGFQPLVRALHALLGDTKTGLPLAIAITAPWGAGKSSVMTQLRYLLDPPEVPRAARGAQIDLHSEAGPQAAGGAGPTRTWRTVEFPAWKFERSERLWAALVKAIYDQSLRRMSWRQKVVFRLRLDWSRLGAGKAACVTVVPLVAATTAILTAASAHPSNLGSTVTGISAIAILGTLGRYGTMFVNPFRRAIEKYARRPDYEAQLGFTAEADKEIGHLIKLVAPDPEHGLAVFVDDLDRCSSAHVVEVVEAMNQIFNTGQNQCAFILGLDRDVVAANIEVAYSDTVRQLKSDSNPLGDNFGAQYLAKLVQLSVAIPQPDADGVRRLMEKILGEARPEPTPPPTEAEIQTAQEQIVEQAADETPESVASAAVAVAATGSASGPSVKVAERRERAQRLKVSRPVIEAEYSALALLDPNPRQIKRFHNAFRLQLYVASEDDRVSFHFTPDQLAALARSVALRLRWPHIADAIAREPGLLVLIEQKVNRELGRAESDALEKRPEKWLKDAAVIELFGEENPSRRLSALQLDTFLRVT